MERIVVITMNQVTREWTLVMSDGAKSCLMLIGDDGHNYGWIERILYRFGWKN